MADVLYGCRLLRLAPLDADGGVPATPTWTSVVTPQQVQVQPQVSQGQTQELRGGDKLLAVITEDDEYTGMDLTFHDAELNGAAVAIIAGGTFDSATGTYTPPALGAARTHFVAELYVAKYTEGSQHSSDVAGYIKFTFPNCSGSLPQFTAQDRNYLVPQFTIKARDNKTDGLRFFKWEEVAALPA